MSKLSQNHRVVFRAYMPQALTRNNDFFWRASVFDAFDGRSWKHGNVSDYIWKPAQQSVNQAPAESSYRVEFEIMQDQRLMRLDLPGMDAHLNIDHIESGQGELFLSHGKSATQYTVSVLSPRAKSQAPNLLPLATSNYSILSPQQRQRYLSLPAAQAPKTRSMVAAWRQAAGDKPQAQQIMRKALSFFANSGFLYSTENIRIDGDLIDGFLFGQRRGYCEHYASAFVFMMRAAGIPARVVSGYRGADYQADGDYFIVRQSFAHAWAEVWLPRRGWLRVDPTAYVSVDSGGQGLLKQLSSLARQFSLRLAWFQDLDSHRLLLAMLLCMSLFLLLPTFKPLLAALRYLPRVALHRPPRAIEVAAGDSFRQLARSWRRHGVTLGDSDDIETWAASVSRQRPDLKPLVAEFTHLYNNLRYGRDKAWGQLQRLSRLQRQLKM